MAVIRGATCGLWPWGASASIALEHDCGALDRAVTAYLRSRSPIRSNAWSLALQ